MLVMLIGLMRTHPGAARLRNGWIDAPTESTAPHIYEAPVQNSITDRS